MSPKTRVIAAGLLWALIYFGCLYVIPGLGPVRTLREAWPRLGSGDVTQALFLICSMTAMLVIGRGDLSSFGFKTVRPGSLIKPVLVTAGLSAGLFVVGMIAKVVIEGPPTGGGGSADGDGMRSLMSTFLKTLISVWIVASTCEEIFYRGLVQTLLGPLRSYGFKFMRIRISLPVLISGVVFGLGHLCLMSMVGGVFLGQIIVSCTVVGVVAAYYREKTGSLIPAIAAHMTANIVGYTIPRILMSLAGEQGV